MRAREKLGFFVLVSAACASPRFVASDFAKNRPRVELREATSRQRPVPGPRDLVVRYLRSGGVYFEWQGQALVTAPFATNYPLVETRGAHYRFDPGAEHGPRLLPSERIDYDCAAIDHVLDGIPNELVGAILVGHTHYDHIGDLPAVAWRMPEARVYVNDSGARALAGEKALDGRVVSVEHERGFVNACPREPCLVRFLALPSEHAPNLEILGLGVAWQSGEIPAPFASPLAGHRLSSLKVGRTLAFLIDFMDPERPERVAFRVHYQDAASRPPLGYPPRAAILEHPVDLEVVTMPGRETLPPAPDRYPDGVLRFTQARHALVIHYEDFFRKVLQKDGTSNGVRLIPTLAGGPAEDFLRAVSLAIVDPAPGPCAPPFAIEGLCGDAFTLPLPGEWLVFDTDP